MDEPKKVTREREQVAKLYSQLIASPLVKFPAKGLDAPMQEGVYVIYGPNGRVLHVGSTPSGFQGIWQRLRNHLHKASSFTLVHLKGNGAQLRNGYGFRCMDGDKSPAPSAFGALRHRPFVPRTLGNT
jgi:hypothetical protein